EAGQRQLSQYTRYATLGLACIQGFIATKWVTSLGVTLVSNISFYCISIITLVAGALFLMWLGEQITERGIGNGVSLIIFAGIVSDFPPAAVRFIEYVRQKQVTAFAALLTILMIVAVIYFVVFIER